MSEDEFINPDPRGLDPVIRGLRSCPEFFKIMKETALAQVLKRYIDTTTKKSREEKGLVPFPLEDFGLSCYITGIEHIMEILSNLQWDIGKKTAETEVERKIALDAFKTVKQAWLELRFNTFGSEKQN